MKKEQNSGVHIDTIRSADQRVLLRAVCMGMAAVFFSGFLLAPCPAQEKPMHRVDHLVPADKNLDRGWVQSLFARGEAHAYAGKDLDTIGMPAGGIAAGQVYLLGDGRLGCWKIFNDRYFSGTGRDCYRTRTQETPVEQGFAVVVEVDGKRSLRRLNREDFPGVTFTGEYPIGRVKYADRRFPLGVEMEAFSPFIPLNPEDSTLPATLFHITLENVSEKPVKAGVLGWLENAVCHPCADEVLANLETRIERTGRKRTVILHSASPIKERKPAGQRKRPAVVLADFEGKDYGGWRATGGAFGRKPASGTLPRQQKVSGFLGKGLVNTYLDRDRSTGTLTSPPFTITRNYLNFLIGGGNRSGATCMNLLVEGKVVRTSTGKNDERLTWRTWNVRAFAKKKARIRIVDRYRGGWGHINVDHIELSDAVRIQVAGSLEDRPGHGTLALALEGKAAGRALTGTHLAGLPGVRTEVSAASRVLQDSATRYSSAVLSDPVRLAPGARVTIPFVVAWHFSKLGKARIHGLRNRLYGKRFPDAAAVARYVLDNRGRLAGDTRVWHDTFYGGTLPRWLLHRVHSTVSNCATGLCYLLENGRFWSWEGVGCCYGTCTHVWNYAHALAYLFPGLERSVREHQDLGVSFKESGLVCFRSESKRHTYAADGQAGTVLKCYREHLCSTNDRFLRRNWPRIRRVLEYSIRKDADDDGLITCSQHNTFDINFHGANTFVGSLYLAALRAGEAMAREMGEGALADRYRTIFESGRRLTVERLWNGEYFIQEVDLKKHPRRQYATGCLSDQLFGQGWAHLLALGHLYPEDHVRKALASVWKYNWAPDVGPQNRIHKPQRCFAEPGEAGLFTCTWPRSKHLGPTSMLYRNEVWTGIEYQVAGHMIREGLVKEGLAIMRAIHDRYHPRKRNPYNEVECGDHYARAMASWGAFTALQGFEHHGPRGHLGFSPRLTPENFRSAFTAAGGWGTFTQKRTPGAQTDILEVRWGRVDVKHLAFTVPDTISDPKVTVTASGRKVGSTRTLEGGRLEVTLEKRLTLAAGDVLRVVYGARTKSAE